MTGQAMGWDSIKVWREAAHMAASLALLVITGVDLMNPQKQRSSSNARGFNVGSS